MKESVKEVKMKKEKENNILPFLKYSKKNGIEYIANNYKEKNIIFAFDNVVNFSTLIYRYYINDKKAHNHLFDYVIKDLYYYPESFKIDKKEMADYSKQELGLINTLKSYFKLIELKDVNYTKEEKEYDLFFNKVENKKNIINTIKLIRLEKKAFNSNQIYMKKRANNVLAKKYYEYDVIKFRHINMANKILDKKKDYVINKYEEYYKSNINKEALVMDDKNIYIGIIKIIEEKVISIKDLSNDLIDYKLDGYNNIEDYKNDLISDFKLLENDKIVYSKIKVVKDLRKIMYE